MQDDWPTYPGRGKHAAGGEVGSLKQGPETTGRGLRAMLVYTLCVRFHADSESAHYSAVEEMSAMLQVRRACSTCFVLRFVTASSSEESTP